MFLHPIALPSRGRELAPAIVRGMIGTMPTASPRPARVFWSYAHADEKYRVKLGKQFATMRQLNEIVDWHDRMILAGSPWDDVIRAELDSADVILLLLSPDFIASAYCWGVEVKRAMERHHDGSARVVPVFVRPCDVDGLPFAKLQGVPRDAKAIVNWRPQDNGYHDVGIKVRAMVAETAPARVGPAASRKGRGLLGRLVGAVAANAVAAAADAVARAVDAAGPVDHFIVLASPGSVLGAVVEGAAAPSPEPAAAAKVDRGRLPTGAGTLFGRDAMFEALDRAWAGEVAVATIVADGGSGKSVLVDRWLDRLQERRWDGAAKVFGWSFYSQGSDRQGSADEFLDAALAFFGFAGERPPSAWDRGVALAELLRAEKCLLVLDGLEPLQYREAPLAGRLKDQGLQGLLRTLARKGHPGLCLVTSRAAVADLARWEEAGAARHLDLHQLAADAGADLLAALGVTGSPERLARLAGDFGGHALALALLGCWLRDHWAGNPDKADLLRRHARGAGPDDHAHRVLEAVADTLTPPQQAVLLLLGLFDRPADPRLVAALCAPVLPGLTDALAGPGTAEWQALLAELRRIRLLLPEDHPGVLDAHPLVREAFAARLKESRPEVWRLAHSRLFDTLCQMAPPLPETVDEMAPLLLAVAHGCAAGRQRQALGDVLVKRIDRGGDFFASKRLGADAARLAALAALFDPPWTRPSDALTAGDRAFVVGDAGFALRAVGRLAEAIEPMRAALAAYEAGQDWRRAAVVAGNFSEAVVVAGRIGEAEDLARRNVAHADRSGDAFEKLVSGTILADALAQAGRRQQAAALFEESERRQRDTQPDYPILYSLLGFRFCDLLLDGGDWPAVRARATQTRDWAEQRGLLLDLALDTLSLGRAAHLAARTGETAWGDAAARLDEAVAELRRAGSMDHLPRGLLARAALRLDLPAPEFDGAADDLDEAREIAESGGMRLFLADVLLRETRLALARRQTDAARSILAQARAEIAAMGYHRRDSDLAELERMLAAG